MSGFNKKWDDFFGKSENSESKPVDRKSDDKISKKSKPTKVANSNQASKKKATKDSSPQEIVPQELLEDVSDATEEARENESFRKERDIRKLRLDNTTLKTQLSKYQKAFDAIEMKLALVEGVRNHQVDTFKILPKTSSGKSEAVAFMIASDWHVEEGVDPKTINNLNEYTPAIAQKRATMFFQNGLRLAKITNQDIEIKTVVLALLGDFFSNNIHDELVELNALPQIEAVWFAQKLIASGIHYILDNSDYDLVIPCHSGNHARTTKKVHFAKEAGHSLEYYMYQNLADHFRDNPRVKFLISEGYHSYLDIFDTKIRIHHGHTIKYGGGVGGIYIPTNKAIAQWNKAKNVDLDIFGHFHQFRDGGNFIANGSMIGYNSYALSIKAEYEDPKQAFFLIDKKRGKTVVAPICFI